MTGFATRLATRAVALLPDRVADSVVPWRRRVISSGGLSTPAPASRRLLIGPVNSAGQGYAWARAAERYLPDTSAVDFMYRDANNRFGYPADHEVSTPFFVQTAPWQRAQRRAVSRRFTHVIIESGRQLLGTADETIDQVRWLESRGVAVALLFHGSDIRVPSEHAAHEPDSPFRHGYPETARLEEIALRNRALAAQAGVPVFVSTPDLLPSAPGAVWLPVVVDADLWAGAGVQPPLARERPVVVHAPSNAGLKGSERIGEAVRRLSDEGLIEYREARGIPAAEMPRFYGDADIVLDQFALGIYGVATCEALGAGRLVISHVGESTRRHVRETTGRELPVVEARASELEARLREVLAAPERFRELAGGGPAFVRDVHDGRRSAAVLGEFLAGGPVSGRSVAAWKTNGMAAMSGSAWGTPKR